MKLPHKALLIGAILASAGLASAADSAPSIQRPTKSDVASAKSPDLQKLIDLFNSKRDSMLADREALLNQLKNATEEQRKAILDKIKAEQKDRIEEQRALGKQIRDEMRKLKPAAGK